VIRKILFADNPILRKKAQKVKRIDASIQNLIDDMIDTMRAANGVGLAAPQIGVSQRVIVIEIPADEQNPQSRPQLYTLINPEIIKASEEKQVAEEGCLCLPNYVGQVPRAASVTVKARDRRGKEVRIQGTDLLARALQHEIDHLDGVLFVDRIEDMSTFRYVPPKEEEQREDRS